MKRADVALYGQRRERHVAMEATRRSHRTAAIDRQRSCNTSCPKKMPRD